MEKTSKREQRLCLSLTLCSHLGFCIFVMFSIFENEMQYIFLEKNFIIMNFLAVKVVSLAVSSGIFNRQKHHEDEVFL